VLLVLLATTAVSALPYSLLSLVLLLAMLFITFRSISPRLKVIATLAIVFFLPLILVPLLNHLTLFPLMIVKIAASVSILPVIYLLDDNLRQNAQYTSIFARGRTKGRYITHTSGALFAATLTMLAVSLALDNPALLFTVTIFALYLLAITIRVFLAIPPLPFVAPNIRKRVMAGATADISLPVESKASVSIHSLVSPLDSWVKVTPQTFTSHGEKTNLHIACTPPLAGPSRPRLQASVIDPWGFIQTNQVLAPAELHVIPRVRYAEWLAMKYLERTGAGVTAASTLPPKVITMPKRGIEYHDSRQYQPGDRLRDVDWKPTFKLNQLIIKEYIEAGEQAAIIAVNLSVADAEEADKLAFNLITTALTLAQEGIPSALAAYNHQRVILTTTVTDSREILKRTLSLVKDIVSAEFAQRSLQLPDISRLRQNIAKLKQATSEPARQLLGMLNFEHSAIEETAKNHPATTALLLVAELAPAPAIIALISQLNHDAEALLVATEKLSRRNFTIIPIEIAR